MTQATDEKSGGSPHSVAKPGPLAEGPLLELYTQKQPPPGLVAMCIYDFEQLQRHFPGIDTRWAPADGRVVPASSMYAKIRKQAAGRDHNDVDVEVRVPDLRGRMVISSYSSFPREDLQDPLQPIPYGALEPVNESGKKSPATSIHFYVRIN